jgi:hypothetical protein
LFWSLFHCTIRVRNFKYDICILRRIICGSEQLTGNGGERCRDGWKFIRVCALAYCRYALIPFTCFCCSGVSSRCDEAKSLNILCKLLIRSSGNSQHGKEMNLSKNPVSFNTKRGPCPDQWAIVRWDMKLVLISLHKIAASHILKIRPVYDRHVFYKQSTKTKSSWLPLFLEYCRIHSRGITVIFVVIVATHVWKFSNHNTSAQHSTC